MVEGDTVGRVCGFGKVYVTLFGTQKKNAARCNFYVGYKKIMIEKNEKLLVIAKYLILDQTCHTP